MTRELDEILSGKEPEQEQVSTEPKTEQPEPEKQETQPRADDGKFASKEKSEPEKTEAVTEPTAQPEKVEKSGQVPQQALHAAREKEREERARAERLERELAEVRGQVSVLAQQRQPEKPKEEPKPKPDFWNAPDEYVASNLQEALTPVQQQLAETTFYYSQRLALSEHGQEKIAAAQDALKAAIERKELDGATVAAQLRQSRDPVGDVVRWHLDSPASKEESLRAQIRAELEAELKGEQPPAADPEPAAQPNPTVMPSNLAGARNVGNRAGPEWSGPQPLSDIFERTRKAG